MAIKGFFRLRWRGRAGDTPGERREILPLRLKTGSVQDDADRAADDWARFTQPWLTCLTPMVNLLERITKCGK
jgi:hypothetical protein